METRTGSDEPLETIHDSTGGRRVAEIGGVSRESAIGVASFLLAVLATAVDHLLDEDGSFADPPAFGIGVAVSLAVAIVVFGWAVPRAREAGSGSAATRGFVRSLLAVPAIAVALLGPPFVLGAAGIALGLVGRDGGAGSRARAAVGIGAAVLLFVTGAYVWQLVEKLA